MGETFEHTPHPHIAKRRESGPVKVADQVTRTGIIGRINGAIGLRVTAIVGTMWAAYVFLLIALYGLPTAWAAGPSGLVLWISSECFQLVLLPIIIVGQNIQGRAADKRAEQTYQDAEAILAECLKLQAHLKVQDDAVLQMQTNLGAQDESLAQMLKTLQAVVLAQPKPRASKTAATS